MNEARGHPGKEQEASGPEPATGLSGPSSLADSGTEVSLQGGPSNSASETSVSGTVETVRARLAGDFYSDPEVLAEVARRIIERGHI